MFFDTEISSCSVSLLFIQKLAVLKDGFQLDSGSQQELWGSSPSLANSELSIPRLYSDAGSQTDIPAEVSQPGKKCVSALSGRGQIKVKRQFSSWNTKAEAADVLAA